MRSGFAVALGVWLAVAGGLAAPERVRADHGASHLRAQQITYDHVEVYLEHYDLIPNDNTTTMSDGDVDGWSTANWQNLGRLQLRTTGGVFLPTLGTVQVRVQFDYHFDAHPNPGDCGATIPMDPGPLISVLKFVGTGGGTPYGAETIMPQGVYTRCEEGAIDSVVTLDSTTESIEIGGHNQQPEIQNLTITVSDPDGAVIPPDCEDDPDAFCDEIPDWPPEDCETPADPADVPGAIGWLGCTVFGALEMLFSILGYIASFIAYAVGQVLAAIGGIVAGILDGLLAFLGDLLAGVGDLLSDLFIPGEQSAWDDFLDLLNSKVPFVWIAEVIAFVGSAVTAGALTGADIPTSLTLFGSTVTVNFAQVYGPLADFRPILAGLVVIGTGIAIFRSLHVGSEPKQMSMGL